MSVVWSFFLNNWKEILSVVSCVITLITFLQVIGLKRAQVKYDELVEVENLKSLLSRLSDFFISNVQIGVEVNSLQNEIHRSIGKIEGVKNALSIKKSKKTPDTNMPQYIPSGYYSDPFLAEKIRDTKLVLRIFAKRNQRISNMDHLQSISNLLGKCKNCSVELMTVSPDASDDILNEMNRTIPIPAQSVAMLRNELTQNKDKILAFKNTLEQAKKDRFHYYEYLGLPPFHCIQVDDYLYFGLVNYHKSSETYTVVENRPCVKFDIKTTDFAQRIKKQLESFIDDCKNNGRVC